MHEKKPRNAAYLCLWEHVFGATAPWHTFLKAVFTVNISVDDLCLCLKPFYSNKALKLTTEN